jgi:hypothetical protein
MRSITRLLVLTLAAVLSLGQSGCLSPQARLQAAEESERERDLDVLTIRQVVGEVVNAVPVQLQGVGLVTGLDGTGGGAPPNDYRKMLERELRLAKVENVKALLDSPNNALVLVTAVLPAGTRRGDSIDVQVFLPPGSSGSLKGGVLFPCQLRPYESSHNINPERKNRGLDLAGHVLAHASGPLLVGLGSYQQTAKKKPKQDRNGEVRSRETSDEDVDDLSRGYIWGGGVSHTDRPYGLMLKKDAKFAKVASKIADRINLMYFEDFKLQQEVQRNKNLLLLDEVVGQLNIKGDEYVPSRNTAKPMNKDLVFVNLPFNYRLNAERYLRVSGWIPLQEVPEHKARYRQRLRKMLDDPMDTTIAALRLEALGKESIPVLRDGLTHEHPLVRFCSAEALAYLGNTAGCQELAKLAREHVPLQALCLKALAALNAPASRDLLTDLLNSDNPKLRCGAFRALRWCSDDKDLERRVGGLLLNKRYWLHRVAPQSAPLVNFAVGQRAEIVLFGQQPRLAPPVHVRPGKDFTVTAEVGDDRCTIIRYLRKEGVSLPPVQCSLRLEEVLYTLSELGAQYPDVIDFLHKAAEQNGLSCPLTVDAQPDEYPIEFLTEKVHENPDFLGVSSRPFSPDQPIAVDVRK